MPTYEYECQKCGKVFELVQSMTEPPRKRCIDKNCKGKVNRLIGAGGGLIFKGSGFYITDYKKKSGGESAAKSDPFTFAPFLAGFDSDFVDFDSVFDSVLVDELSALEALSAASEY